MSVFSIQVCACLCVASVRRKGYKGARAPLEKIEKISRFSSGNLLQNDLWWEEGWSFPFDS